ncbi:MAG: 16S rRNA (guanine(966)-N(2))-methyltransferase RsmD [Planctomycetota bacterium]|nr:16S rRNA (guanine(966)-N(2))-methyltransferase RsmD [Planctomycetota bacterium]
MPGTRASISQDSRFFNFLLWKFKFLCVMRIIAGKWRGIRLLSPPGTQTRPILDHVKEAVFNILGAKLAEPGRIPPCRVLDLFAGTGSLGLEALSRGASLCIFVEKHRATAGRLRENLQNVKAGELGEVLVADVLKTSFRQPNPKEAWELVFLDPPYDLARSFDSNTPIWRLVDRLCSEAVLKPDATVVLRHPRKTDCTASTFEQLQLVDQRSYGEMTISVFDFSSVE